MTSGELPRFGRFLRSHLAILLVIGGGLGLRLFHLDRHPLWADEVSLVTWAKGREIEHFFGVLSDETGMRLPARPLREAFAVLSNHYPPLNGLTLNLWMGAFGDRSDFSTRLLNALLSSASIWTSWLALNGALGGLVSRRIATVAAGFIAFSPFQVFYAQEVTHYAPGFFWTTLSFLYYLRYLQIPTRGSGLGWVLSGTASLYSHYFCGFVLMFQWAALLLDWRRRGLPLGRALGPPVGMAVLFLPYLPQVVRQLGEMSSYAGAFGGGSYFLERFPAAFSIPYLGEHLNQGLAGLTALGLALVLGIGLREIPPRLRSLILLNALGPFVMVFFLYWFRENSLFLRPRYHIFFAFSLFTWGAIVLTTRSWPGRLTMGALVMLAAQSHHYQFFVMEKEKWKAAANAIDSVGERSEPVLVFHGNLAYALARYLEPGRRRLFGIGSMPELESVLERVLVSDPNQNAAWYVFSWPDGSDSDRTIREVLNRRYRTCETQPSVEGGLSSMSLTRCLDRDTTPFVPAPLALEAPTSGPLTEAGYVDRFTASTAAGWAFSTSGVRSIRASVGGRVVAEVLPIGLPRPDVSAAFPHVGSAVTGRAGFWLPLPGGVSIADAAQSLRVFAVRPDGAEFELTRAPLPLR